MAIYIYIILLKPQHNELCLKSPVLRTLYYIFILFFKLNSYLLPSLTMVFSVPVLSFMAGAL